MKKFLVTLLTLSLLGSTLFAKSTPTKKRDITTIKKEKLSKLISKKNTIEKRIACIKKASSTKEIRECEKKYPLIKRNKKAKKKTVQKMTTKQKITKKK